MRTPSAGIAGEGALWNVDYFNGINGNLQLLKNLFSCYFLLASSLR